jgi:hypothetical protein
MANAFVMTQHIMETATLIEGRWWIRGKDTSPEFGTLVSNNKDGLSLIVKIPQGVSVDEAMGRFERADARCEVIYGVDADEKPVTLFGCLALGQYSAGLITYKISVLAALQGLEVESWSQQCIRAASVDVDLLHRWLGTKIVEVFKTPSDKSALVVPNEPDLVFDIYADVRLRIVRFIGTSWSLDKYDIRPRHRVWLHFATPISLDDLTTNWIPWLSRLF